MSLSIYIADDEKNIRELIYSFLCNEGYTVTAFENGDDLLAEFLEHPCDMVILDIMMDGTDGLSVCSRIRQQHKVPIIIVSARDSELDRITGISLGSDDYLVKPFSPLELVARVKAIFRRIAFDREGGKTPVLNYGNMVLNID
ncbi:MAG TPA: response regulator transcription factor, partial [Bacteroidales bacterium]|nr:response regulator transcription factor [Bacteroidales bacterium]